MRARLTRAANEQAANEQVDELLSSVSSGGTSTEESLMKIQVEALSGRVEFFCVYLVFFAKNH